MHMRICCLAKCLEQLHFKMTRTRIEYFGRINKSQLVNNIFPTEKWYASGGYSIAYAQFVRALRIKMRFGSFSVLCFGMGLWNSWAFTLNMIFCFTADKLFISINDKQKEMNQYCERKMLVVSQFVCSYTCI